MLNLLPAVSSSAEDIIRSNQINFTLTASVLLFLLVLVSAVTTKMPKARSILFISMAAIIILDSLYLLSSTVYVNVNSITGGPVHWHADFQIYNCGTEVDLIDPHGLSNRVGTATLHEHNDRKIHLEGPVFEESDASLGRFFRIVGGELTSSSLTIPTNQGTVKMIDGGMCNGEMGKLQVFLYETKDKTFTQRKLDDPAAYIIKPESQVPPGDCVIIEFDKVKDKTDKLCTGYQVQEVKGKIYRGS